MNKFLCYYLFLIGLLMTVFNLQLPITISGCLLISLLIMCHKVIKKLLIKLLNETIEKVEADSCEVSEEEFSSYIDLLANETMSKEDCCSYLRISRASFDKLIANGELPKGKKRRGFKELSWHRSDLIKFVNKKKQNLTT